MTPEQQKFLDRFRPAYEVAKSVQVFPMVQPEERRALLEIARTFDPTYTNDVTCSDCLPTIFLYVFEQADKAAAPPIDNDVDFRAAGETARPEVNPKKK